MRYYCFFLLSMITLVSCRHNPEPRDEGGYSEVVCDDPDCIVRFTNDSLPLDSAFNTPSGGLFQALGPDRTGITFFNNVQGTFRLNHYSDPYFLSSAVAVADLNNDGFQDLIFKGSHKSVEIYKNLGGLRFENITARSGVAHTPSAGGISTVDVNGDGLLDIYVSQATPEPRNLLFVNKGNFEFSESASVYGIADTSHTTNTCFFDFDQDGDLDAYLLNHCTDYNDRFRFNLYNKIAAGENTSDKLYVNNGSGKFEDRSLELGINNHSYGLGVSLGDLNQDGNVDLVVGNDYLFPDQVLINRPLGHFSNLLKTSTGRCSLFGMGTDIADINNDGMLDYFTADMNWSDNISNNTIAIVRRRRVFMDGAQNSGYHYQYSHNMLQVSNGDGSFSEQSYLAGLETTDWSWSPLLADFDNDGFKDLFITNGFYHPIHVDQAFWEFELMKAFRQNDYRTFYKILDEHKEDLSHYYYPNKIYRNPGQFPFIDQTQAWGMDFPTQSYGACYADLDNDGDLDIAVANMNQVSFIYENQSENNFLRVKLNFSKNNRDGIGSSVRLHTGSGTQFGIVSPVKGSGGQSETAVHFGLGKDIEPQKLEVLWPNGKTTVHPVHGVNQEIEIDFSTSKHTNQNFYPKAPPSLFRSIKPSTVVAEERDFSDFDKNYALIRKLSSAGPCLASEDINGDGLTDIYVGGGSGFPSQLLIQNQNGVFKRSIQTAFDLDKHHEDAAALFIDVDLDSDLDLVVTSSETENPNQQYYSDGLLRVYKNDGSGHFTRSVNSVPIIPYGLSGLVSYDFDADGDDDLFVGNQIGLDKYPESSSHPKILVNNGGSFSDKTKELAADLMDISTNISSALWSDYDLDGDRDLICVGELSPILIFENHNGQFNLKESPELGNCRGMWNSINGGDFDADGDVDYIIGNWGLNSSLKADSSHPLNAYYGDFDGDGGKETMITHFVQGVEYPIYGFDVFSKILPNFSGCSTYQQYAEMSLLQLVGADAIDGSFNKSATTLESVYLENTGNGFVIHKLPIEAQVSTIFGTLVEDFNQDGVPDVLIQGNFYGTDPTMDRMSESTGVLLLGDHNDSFIPVRSLNSGFWSRKESRALGLISSATSQPLVVSTNFNDTVIFHETLAGLDKMIVLDPKADHIVVKDASGGKYLRELYQGEGYRTQRTKTVLIPGPGSIIEQYDRSGYLIKSSKTQ